MPGDLKCLQIMFSRILLSFFIFWVFIFVYLRYYEKKQIYFPSRDIMVTPLDLGMGYEDVFFNTQDGLKLHAWFVPAQNPKATLLFCHGNAGNISHRVDVIQIFQKLNLNVLIFDYRGYGKSQGVPGEQGLYKDAQAAYDYLAKHKDVRAEKIVIYGKSIGANVAINLAADMKTNILIADSGFTSAYEMGKRLFPFLPIKWIITIKYDALEKIKQVRAAKLIIHSPDDELIPFDMGRRLFETANQPKQFFQAQGTHNEGILIYAQEYRQKIDEFLGKYLDTRY